MMGGFLDFLTPENQNISIDPDLVEAPEKVRRRRRRRRRTRSLQAIIQDRRMNMSMMEIPLKHSCQPMMNF